MSLILGVAAGAGAGFLACAATYPMRFAKKYGLSKAWVTKTVEGFTAKAKK